LNTRRLALISLGLALGFTGNLVFGQTIGTFILDIAVITLLGPWLFLAYAYATFLPVFFAGLNMPTFQLTFALVCAPVFYTLLAYIPSKLMLKPLITKLLGGKTLESN